MKSLIAEFVNLVWNVNDNNDNTEEVLRSNIQEIYKILQKHDGDNKNILELLSSFGILIWNMQLDKWSTNLDVLIDKDKIDKLLMYIHLDSMGIFESSTNIIFGINPNPQLVLEYKFTSEMELEFEIDKTVNSNDYKKIVISIPEEYKKEYKTILDSTNRNKQTAKKNYKYEIDDNIDKTQKKCLLHKIDKKKKYSIANEKKNFVNQDEHIRKIISENDKKKIEEILKEINLNQDSNSINDKDTLTFFKSILNISGFIERDESLVYIFNSTKINESNNKNFQRDGGVIYYTVPTKKIKEIKELHLFIISNILFSKSSSAQRALLKRYNDLYSTKSAIASIMSRNMSHNLGSHVLSAVSTGINDPTDIQYLTRYIQQRQDYIAQITTEFPKWSHSYRFIGQIMRYFFEQRLLLKYIAESEGLTAKEYYPENPENQIGDNNTGKLRFEINRITDENERINEIPKEETDPDRGEYTLNDPLLAIPGGITGVQAFYSILENIIRNAAKHSYSLEKDINTEDGGLKVIIDYKIKETYVEFTIYTNVTKNEYYEEINKPDISDNYTKYYKLNDNNDYVKIENEEDFKTHEKIYEKKHLKDKLNEKISKSFIDDKNELKYENWGIAEIKISSGYLINASIELLGENSEKILYKKENKNDFGIIKAVEANSFKDSILIGYQFRINKPKEVLIISKKIKINDTQKNELNNNGIYIETELPEVLDYNITVINNKEDNKLPVRTIQLDNNIEDIIKGLLRKESIKQKDAEGFIIELYNVWINTFNKNFELFIMPYEQNNNKAANVTLYGVDNFIKEKFKNNQNYSYDSFIVKYFEGLDIEKYKLNKKVKSEIVKYTEKIIEDNYYSISEITYKIFKKYNEFIETLPANYRFSKVSESEENNTVIDSIDHYKNELKTIIEKINNNNIKYKNNEIDNNKTVYLNRHMSFNNFGKALYREALSGAQSYFNEIKSIKKNYSGKKLLLNIIETAYYQIHIIDERVAEYYYGFKKDSIIRKRIDNAGIKVYGKLNDKEIIKTTNNNLNNFMWKNENVTKLDNNILIIHQGIIDKFKKDFDIEIEKKNNPPAMFKEKYFITSGRGKPEEEKMPENAKYIPFSSISTSIIKQYPEKMLLIQSLLKIS